MNVSIDVFKKDIKKYVVQKTEKSDVDLKCSFEELGIDSIGFIQMIVYIESNYLLEINDDTLNIENHKNLDEFCECVWRYANE